MRITLDLDDELLAQAQRITGLTDSTLLLRKALLALAQRESARRLARLGGTMPECSPLTAAGMLGELAYSSVVRA